MKTAICFFTVCFKLIIGVCLAENPVFDIRVELPLQLREVLLERTGAESIHSINGIVLKTIKGYDILAVKAELKNWSDIKVGIQEGIMHVVVAFVEETKTGRVRVYDMDFPINNLIMMDEIDFNRGFTEIKAVGKKQ